MHPIQFALQSLFTQNPTTTKSNINLIPCCDEASRSTKPFMTNNANACTLLALPHHCQCQSMWIFHQTNRKKLTERNSYKYPTTIKLRIRLILLSPFLALFIKVKRTRLKIKTSVAATFHSYNNLSHLQILYLIIWKWVVCTNLRF